MGKCQTNCSHPINNQEIINFPSYSNLTLLDENNQKYFIMIPKNFKIFDMKKIIYENKFIELNKNEDLNFYSGSDLLDDDFNITSLNSLVVKLKIISQTNLSPNVAEKIPLYTARKSENQFNNGEMSKKSIEPITLNIQIISTKGDKLLVKTNLNSKIIEIIEEIKKEWKIDTTFLLLSYKGEQLATTRTIGYYQIKAMDSVFASNCSSELRLIFCFLNKNKREKIEAPQNFEVVMLKDIICQIINKNIDDFEIEYNGKKLDDSTRLGSLHLDDSVEYEITLLDK